MATIKVLIAEVDGVEYEYPVEKDLNQALIDIGFSASGFNEDLILCSQEFESLFDSEGNLLMGVN